MSQAPLACPQCTLENTYPDGDQYVCADCGFEWPQVQASATDEGDADTTVVKGSSTVLKVGTKVKSIRLVGGDHEVDCKMDAGSFMLKACFLKKA